MTMRYPLSGAMYGSVTPRALTRLSIVSTACVTVSRSIPVTDAGFVLNSMAPSALVLTSHYPL